jgi:septum formation protein
VAATAANAIVLGCDSALLLDGEILGKPLTAEVAIARWGKLRGNSGTLYSGHHLIDTKSKQVTSLVTKTEVNFSDLSDDQIARYVATGEPLQVAGAFTIDGLGGAFIESISGDYHTVVGLSLVGLRKMISELGHDYQDFWR